MDVNKPANLPMVSASAAFYPLSAINLAESNTVLDSR